MGISKLLTVLILGLVAIWGANLLGPDTVRAACASGYTCSGTTVVDKGVGCSLRINGTCSTDWERVNPFNCDANCGGSFITTVCMNGDGSPPFAGSCPTSSTTGNTNCCVLAAPTATPAAAPTNTPPPGCVPGGCNTSGCSTTACGQPCGRCSPIRCCWRACRRWW